MTWGLLRWYREALPVLCFSLMCFISTPTRVLRGGQEEKQGGRPSLLLDEYTDLLGGFSWRKPVGQVPLGMSFCQLCPWKKELHDGVHASFVCDEGMQHWYRTSGPP